MADNIARGMASTAIKMINELELEVADTGIAIQDESLTNPEDDALWIDSDSYNRYVVSVVETSVTLDVTANEVIMASGEISITLHSATNEGVIKRIYNTGNNLITIVGTINEETNMYLFPDESVELITDGTEWKRC